jgi:1-acyl-sn-glycerol-3-phosphate acyltransferase
LAIAPEGTRKRVDKLRTGFYHIAKKAQVPIIPAGLDFENKQVVIGEPLFTTDDEAADFEKIIVFFSTIKGKKPAFDLRHLKGSEKI